MPPLRGLLRLPVLRAGPVHPAALVLLVPPDDGCPLLLRRWLLHPEAHVSPTADRGAGLQRVLHQAAPKPCTRSPAAGAALLHRPRRTRDEPCWQSRADGFPGPAQLATRKHGLPSTPFLLQHAPAPLRAGGEGQVVGMHPEPAWVTVQGRQGEAFPACLSCPHWRSLPERSHEPPRANSPLMSSSRRSFLPGVPQTPGVCIPPVSFCF